MPILPAECCGHRRAGLPHSHPGTCPCPLNLLPFPPTGPWKSFPKLKIKQVDNILAFFQVSKVEEIALHLNKEKQVVGLQGRDSNNFLSIYVQEIIH